MCSTVSGVGLNIATAPAALGDDVRLLSQIGADLHGEIALQTLTTAGKSTST